MKKRLKRGLSPRASAIRSFASLAKEPVLIATHANADPDAVASSLALSHLLKHMGLESVDVAFPEGPSRLSRKILSGLGLHLRYLREPPRKVYRAVAVVDATNSVQLSAFHSAAERAELLLVVDHHTPPGDLAAMASYAVIEKEPATAVIICQAAEDLSVPLDSHLATLALAGLIFDSKRFIQITPAALRTAARLVELGGNYELALSLLEEEVPYPERVAKLKGALRSHLLKVGEFVVAVSEIGSFEASVARALVSLGADVALVASERDGECRLSVRLSRSFFARTGLSASRDLAARVADDLGGEGGGHDMAGGYKGPCSASSVLRAALAVLTSRLGSRAGALR